MSNPDTANDEEIARQMNEEEQQRAAQAQERNQANQGRPDGPLLQQADRDAVRQRYGNERMQELAQRVAQNEQVAGFLNDEMIDKFICGMAVALGIVLFFCLVFIITLAVAKSNSEGCGIPVYEWLMIYFSFLPILMIILAFHCCLCRVCNQLKVIGAVMILLLVYQIALAAFIVYGYFIYFSKANDCQSQPDTSVALVFMCIFLILGLGQIILALCFLCIIPMLYMSLMVTIQKMEEEKREFDGLREGFKFTIKNLQMGNAEKEKIDDKCVFCFDDFKDADNRDVTKLPCGHVFHSDCVITWIDSNHIECPTCRQPIPHAKQLQDQMKKDQGGNNEGGEPEANQDDDELLSTVRRTNAVRRRLKDTQARRGATE